MAKKATGFVGKHGVDARNDTSSQMGFDDCLVHGGIRLVGAFGTGQLGFPAQSLPPLIQANRRIAGYAGLFIFPPLRVHIGPCPLKNDMNSLIFESDSDLL